MLAEFLGMLLEDGRSPQRCRERRSAVRSLADVFCTSYNLLPYLIISGSFCLTLTTVAFSALAKVQEGSIPKKQQFFPSRCELRPTLQSHMENEILSQFGARREMPARSAGGRAQVVPKNQGAAFFAGRKRKSSASPQKPGSCKMKNTSACPAGISAASRTIS